MTDIEELVKALKESGIDTTNMTEEQIRELAKTLKTTLDNDFVNYGDVLRNNIKEADNDAANKLRRRVPSPNNQPAMAGNNSAPQQNPQNPNFANKNGDGFNKDNGLNYTDDNKNSRDGKSNQPQNNQPKGKQQPTASQAAGNNAAEQAANVRKPQNALGDLNSGKKDDVEEPDEAVGVQGNNPAMMANGENPDRKLVGQKKGEGTPPPAVDGKPAPTPPPKEDFLNDKKVLDPLHDKVKDIYDNKKNPNLVTNGATPPDGVPAPSGKTPPSPKDKEPEEKEPEEKEPKGKTSGTSNPNVQNKRSYNPADKDAVANNKIERAKNRLRQNGIDPEQGTKPHKRPPAMTPPPVSGDDASGAGESGGGRQNLGGPGGTGESSGLSRKPNVLDKLRNRINGNLQRNREVDDTYNDPKNLEGGIKDKAKKKLKNKLKLFIVRHLPAILLAVGIALLVLFIIFLIVVIFIAVMPDFIDTGSANVNDVGAGNRTNCTYGASGNSGLSQITNAKIELVNCDATSSNYKVLETIDLEKYVLGVALAEIGPDSPDEGIKAQIVAARNVALSRNKSMCPSDPDNCFYGYNKKSNVIRMRACENDQVYWDYEKDIYRQDRGSVSLYSPEVNSGTIWKKALSAERKEQVLALANAVKGEVMLDSSGEPIIAGYKSTDQVSMLEEARAGRTYKEILQKKYGVTPTSNGSNCSIGNIDYNNYQLNNDNSTILHQPLNEFLSSKGTSIEEFNNLIQSNVQKGGTGTRAGVVAAAVTLLGELSNNYNVKVPYFWGGGHEGTYNLAKPSWGSSSCHTYANGQNYNYCGLDCSGFVGWAIYNGGFRDVTTVANSYVNISGARHVNLGSSAALQPGDLLYSSGHVILIIGVDNDKGQYICAEAAGNSSGVIFSRHGFNGDGKYSGVDMTGFYDNDANKRG